MERLNDKALKVFRKEYFPKFLATVDESGVPNVVPVLTLRAADDHTLIFARFMIWKTARNLESTRKATITCVGPGLNIWSVKADFQEFVKHGPYLEEFNEVFMFRYNAYAGVSEVGVLNVREILPPRPAKWVKTLAAQRRVANAAKAHGGNGSGPMPPPVIEQFRKKTGLKYLAHIGEDGYPVARPALAMFPSGSSTLAFCDTAGEGMKTGARLAACVISKDLIAYQVKGGYAGSRMFGGASFDALDVDEVFTASPPLPGKKIEPRN